MKSKRGIILVSCLAAVVVIAAIVVLIIVLGKKEESYRIIKVYKTEGEAVVDRTDIGTIDAYENMVLESGDHITVKDGSMTLKLDDDKYIYVYENTEFELLAEGTAEDSKTTINLLDGCLANELQNKLSEDSYYEINTPNSTMSVRGTVYYVETRVGEDGIRYTKISVFDGAVEAGVLEGMVVHDSNGDAGNKMVSKGNEIIIYGETDAYMDPIRSIEYDELPEDLITTLETISQEHGKDLELPEDLLEQEISENGIAEAPGPFTVTFLYEGKEFGKQTVEKGECASPTSLNPAPSGEWDFDFSTPITEDTEINWK